MGGDQNYRFWNIYWLFIVSIAILFSHLNELQFMVQIWDKFEEYEYGYFVPLIVLYLIHQKRNSLQTIPFPGTWSGWWIVLIGLSLAMLGKLAIFPALVQYAFIITLSGFALAFMGWYGFKVIAVPLLFLVFMIPLPSLVHQELSTGMQLISSQLGVAFIDLYGIEVLLDGNIIDLGNYKLEVAEACNGLRYLFPLASISFLCAYLFQGAFWKRVFIFLSSMPITILMNSLRLGAVGVMVEYWGIGMAEGFMHDFEGWVVYGACLGLLLMEMAMLSMVGEKSESPLPPTGPPIRRSGSVPMPAMASLVLLMIFTGVISMRDTRENTSPPRKSFSEFPQVLGPWQGRFQTLSPETLKVLQPDDYLLADYIKNGQGHWINLYMAYFLSQQTGAAIHSPRFCLPSGGWEIQDLSSWEIPVGDSFSVTVNRTIIKKGNTTQLVYYWFQQQGRNIIDVYLARLYLLKDSLTRQRADSALVRVISVVGKNEKIEAADQRLMDFTKMLTPHLKAYIPD